MVPCQWLMSMPSVRPFAGGLGGGVASDLNIPDAAYRYATP